VDVVAVVICDRAIRIARICKRDGIDEDLANRMVALQMSDAEMTARADVVFDNSGETSDLYRCVDHWMMALKKHEKK
jgi:dephospho-CoA kinase